jgi:hypothetical protein
VNPESYYNNSIEYQLMLQSVQMSHLSLTLIPLVDLIRTKSVAAVATAVIKGILKHINVQ